MNVWTIRIVLFSSFLLLLSGFSFANVNGSAPQKIFKTERTDQIIVLDGKLDENAWQNIAPATNFMQIEPNPGIASSQNSEIKLLYDDKAIYIGAMLFDAQPDSILKQLSERDEFEITDWFGFIIDSYQDGQNGLGFFVTPSGVQVDMKYSAINSGGGSPSALDGDRNWDAVWDSKVTIGPHGWTVEISIPYSALRFPNAEIQQWNINFARMIRRNKEQSFWNEIAPDASHLLSQSGLLSGIRDIKPPVRLSATPFLAVYAQSYHDKNSNPSSSWTRSFNGGMDIKYGINDAFTLDMTLIPDFGQTQSDNQVLNLTPFEVQFDENRQFFTEGTELFSKGDLFYSRRVGGRPLHYGDVENQLLKNEEIIENNAESKLYNATKVSGRTQKGLGIGVFNAISAPTYARIRNTESQETRDFLTNPLTNYNVFVLDQNLKNNSYVTLINTSVWREGNDYDANVTGTSFLLRNKENTYSIEGNASLTQKYFGKGNTDLGQAYNLSIQKTNGNIQGETGFNILNDTYDPNDLGFLNNNNFSNFWTGVSYNRFKPIGKFNAFRGGLFGQYTRLFNPNKFSDLGVNAWFFAVTRNFFAFGVNSYLEPIETFDFFEPRTSDFSRYYRWPRSNNVGGWISSDYRKKFALDMRINFRDFNEDRRYRLNLVIEPRIRINDQLSFIGEARISKFQNDVGYVNTLDNEDIIFGIRDINTIENSFNTSYIFNNKMSLNLRLRHYWSRVSYNTFHLLLENGRLGDSAYDEFSDRSFNAFNIDMVYRWRFAPGSDIFIVWKNGIVGAADEIETVDYKYGNSLKGLGNIPQTNSFSIKVIYFLDYLSIKNRG